MSAFVDTIATRDDDEGSDLLSEEDERIPVPRAEDSEEDSSDEDDDEDEEEARKIREGFIVEDEDPDESARRRRKRSKKRKHREETAENGDAEGADDNRGRRSRARADEEDLDEDDLELLMESGADVDRGLKRLKRAQENELANIFDEDEELPDEIEPVQLPGSGRGGEFDDFIEDDLSEDENDRAEREQRERVKSNRAANRQTLSAADVGMDADAYQDVLDVFGDGEDYADALQSDEEDIEQEADRETVDLKKIFEPSDLQSRMLTDADEIIRMTDEPERVQLARGSYREMQFDEDDFEWLCLWMHKQLYDDFLASKDADSRDRVKENANLETLHAKAVKDVLSFYTRESQEVPYIWNHRREYLECKDERSSNDSEGLKENIKLISIDNLWQIARLEVKFRSLVDKRNSLRKTYSALEIEDQIFEECITTEEINSLQDIADLHEYLHFKYSEKIRNLSAEQTQSTYKRPATKSNIYERAKTSEVYHLVRAIGITAHQFAENVNSNTNRHYAEDRDEHPEDLALTYDQGFKDAQEALKHARNIYVQELLHDPILRKSMRLSYIDIAELTVEPTERGVSSIDEFHPYYEFKYAQGLSVRDLRRAPGMTLQIFKAQEDGFVKVKVSLQHLEGLIKLFHGFMKSDGVSEIAEQWNIQRQMICRQMFEQFASICEKVLLEDLRAHSQDSIASECRIRFREKLNQRPIKCRNLEDDDVPNVLAISNGFGTFDDATVAVFVDEKGKQRQHQRYKDLMTVENQQNLRELVKSLRINIIGIAGFTPQTTRLKANIEAALFELSEYERPVCVYVNDEVARLYQDSPRAKREYPNLGPLYRYCVALAHYVQSPVHEYIALGEDLKQLNWNKYQGMIPSDQLWSALETAMVDIVNLIGVHINKAQESVYEENLLQYVSGLGPRKANYLKRRIAQSGGSLSSRTELLEKRFITKNIFVNCASAFRIRFSKRRFEENYERKDDPGVTQLDVLDETRIHPEDYELANKMAADAQDLDEEDVDALVSSGGPVCVMREKREYDKLDELILEDYADELFRAFNQPKLITLHTIKRELQNPYEERRRDFHLLTEDELFVMLTGETLEKFTEGAIVSARIFRITDRYILCKTESGIELEIATADMALPFMDARPEDHFRVNDAVRGLLVGMDRMLFKGSLTLEPRRISDAINSQKRRIMSTRGHTKWNDFLEETHQSEVKRAQEAQQRTQRVIKHPLFKQFNARQAEEYLGGMQRGDAVIRPSSKGPDHIAVTWKVSDGIFQHLDVLELDKDSTHSVGTKLKIGNAIYSDLDELIVSHVKAMAKKVDEMNIHDKFQRGTRNDTEQYLSKYSEANPRRSCYAFCFNHKHPGYFDLCFKANPKAKIGEWPVKVIPNAFLMRDNMYADMTSLCNGFKLLFAKDSQQRR